MKKEIVLVDEEKKIVRVTTVGERWYCRDVINATTQESETIFVPSVTWICEYFPKSTAYFKWLASKGWDEAEAIKTAAGDKGSRVHKAIQDLIEGKEVFIDAKYPSIHDEEPKELSFEEYDAVLSFARWYKETKPEILACEFAVWGDGYAGTVDLLCRIGEDVYLIDFKTSAYIWPSHELQVSAYKHAIEIDRLGAPVELKLAILQVGYKMNKKRFKFTEVEDQFQEFLAAKLFWAKEQKGVSPRQVDYPMSVRLDQGENNEAPAESKNGVRESAGIR